MTKLEEALLHKDIFEYVKGLTTKVEILEEAVKLLLERSTYLSDSEGQRLIKQINRA